MNAELNAPEYGRRQAFPSQANQQVITASYQEPSNDEADDEIDLRELWQVIVRRKGLIISIAALVFMVALIATLMMTPIYRASATLQIQPETSGKLLEFGVEAQDTRVNDKDFYQTQYELLQSRNLARRTIDTLNLESDLTGEQLAKPFFAETLDEVKALFGGTTNTVSENSDTEIVDETNNNIVIPNTKPNPEELAKKLGAPPLENKFLAGLTVSPVKNSQIVTVSYDHIDPVKAASIANTLTENFIQMNLERRREAASYAEGFLNTELIKAKSKLDESERKLVDFTKEKGIISVDPENKQTLVGQTLLNLTKTLSDAQSERIKAESQYEKTRASSGASKTLSNSTIQELKKQLAQAETQYQAELTAPTAYDNEVVKNLRKELAKLEGDYIAERSVPSARDNAVVRGLRQELTKLQGEYQAQLKASTARDNPVVTSLRQQLTKLQSDYQAEVKASKVQSTDPTIQALTRQLQTLQAEYQEKLQVYKPLYPTMVQLKQKIDTIRSQITAETQTVKGNNINNLKQLIAELEAQILRETQTVSNTTLNNLRQRISELEAQIAVETRTVQSSTVNNLTQRIDQLRAQITQESSTITKTTLKNLEERIGRLRAQIQDETNKITQTSTDELESALKAAQQREAALRADLEKQKAELTELNDKSVGYNTLKREVETNRNLYDALLQRIKEIGVAGGIKANNISVVDPAVIPFAKHKPNTKLNLALGLVLGLFLGTVLAFLLEFLDDRVKTTNDLEKVVKLPLLGITPLIKHHADKDVALISYQDPTSAMAEAFRSLRTNLLFSTSHGAPLTLAITSSMPSEAKSSTCTNLAAVFAQSGKQILVVDCDLRKPTLHKRLSLDNSIGMSTYLTHQATIEEVIQDTPMKGVFAITAGPLAPNPAELLSSERMDELFALAPNRFDMIIIDSPPVMGLADALIIANRASATILVAAHAQSKKRPLEDAYQRLRQANANLIGVIMTKMKTGSSYGYNYDYYYSYGAKSSRKRLPSNA
ncbi:MAG: polysaccharide biosynthesis tyrosine autokinase [Thiofilum sp.]|uniref:polysaccharide biosynthesis tyrosine autokinase n=1 Tax=Thiofilum sp. TaxID=2212733 RepID=UPI0025DA6BD0|nr:polysaccharide biosynthesis tyrosine autokinase [Thiofilum sp.]MBK8453846.1 polysaccharide biosynthesis tyrosine autokinase [Thiofilum sp.]